ncbi:MAG TPA: hypothetical protein VLI55_16425 [Bryobacteraceae bacterium]|nr:hypothetical protein [Bryobacteraceae bacterium]
MLIPTTYASALLLLLLSFVCLGSWANTFKLTGTRWRFELFYVDFAIGAIVLAVVAAYTLGSSGELAFSDRMLVAGRMAQAWVVLGGVIFNFGNMLLVAAISLVGMSMAFPLSAGTALVIWSCFHLQTKNAPLLSIGIVLMIFAVVLDAFACRKVRGNPKNRHPRDHGRLRPSTKGIIAGILGGVALGFCYPVAADSMDPEFGVGPYAGILLFGIGIFLSTIVFSAYFMRITIEGSSLRFNDYLRGRARKHLLGFASGVICLAGILSAVIIDSVPPNSAVNPTTAFILPLASVLLAILWGVARWKELKSLSASAKWLLACTAMSFGGGLAAIGFALAQ